MNTPYIVSYARTPIGSFMGSLQKLSAPKLGAAAIKGALAKTQLEPSAIDEVIMGHVLSAGVGQAPARQAALGAGLLNSTPCTTVNKVCGSGMKAVMMACQSIQLGETHAAIAGGMESMSNAPYLLPRARAGMRMGHSQTLDAMILDGLWDPYGDQHMGAFGEKCSQEFDFSRSSQDQYAIESYRRAMGARDSGFFGGEMVPVNISTKNGEVLVDADEELSKFNEEKMLKLHPVFRKNGTVTAGNASKLNDGAAALIILSPSSMKKSGLRPEAKVIDFATFAQAPDRFTTAPAYAIQKILEKNKLTVAEIDLFEINEAFSNVPMAVMKICDIPHDKLNVWGGGVALGHPIGSSGARIICTLLSALKQRKKRLGLAAICLGGGEAVAMLLENEQL